MKRNTTALFSLLAILLVFAACQKEVSYEDKTIPVALASLKDTAGNCLPSLVHGTYYTGVTPGSDTAYVDVTVRVDSAGTYRIYSDLQNGLMFADSGVFFVPGLQTIRLKPIGTPIAIQPAIFTISLDTSICGFSLSVLDSTGLGLGDSTGTGGNTTDTAWKFTAGASSYNGSILLGTLIDTLGLQYLTVLGTVATGDTAFSFGTLVTAPLAAGSTFSTALEASILLSTSTGSLVYEADAATAGLGSVTITVVSYDTVTGNMYATFSGTAKDAGGNAVSITNGSFTAKIE